VVIEIPFRVFQGVVEPLFCKYALATQDILTTQNAEVEGEGVNTEIRRTRLKWLNQNNPVASTLGHYTSLANRECGWGFDVYGIESVQVGEYVSEEKGYYDWHMDMLRATEGPGIRKLTAVLQLTDPDEYEGGDLEIRLPFTEEVVTVPKGQGNIVVFPSFLYHRVTPVTHGSRSTAVAWFVGPAFR
jgi:PKHD-type hydroxylase